MTLIRSSPSGELIEVPLDPIASHTLLGNPELTSEAPVPITTSAALDFISDTPDELLIRGATEWEGTSLAGLLEPAIEASDNAAKFWAFIDGATKALLDGYNVASVSDPGAGFATINYTSPFATANYAVLASIGATSTTLVQGITVSAQDTTSCTLLSVIEAGSALNPVTFSAAGYGALA